MVATENPTTEPVLEFINSDDLYEEEIPYSEILVQKFKSQLRNRFTKTEISEDDQIFDNVKKDWTPVAYEDLPQWLQLNKHLERGHRPPLPSVLTCTKSLFRIHTETGNAWSHLIASVIFLLIFVHICYFSRYDLMEKIALSPYIVGCIICFALSTIYHTVQCHSEAVSKKTCLCDYFGIVGCLLGALYSGMMHLWWCQWQWAAFYSSVYTILTYILHVTMHDTLVEPENGKLRGLVSSTIGCSVLFVFFHDCSKNASRFQNENYPFWTLTIIVTLCLMAAAIYSTRIPESIWPGKFDIWFHSHQIFHALVMVAAFLGYRFLTALAEITDCNVK